jgi:hypothetical protein
MGLTAFEALDKAIEAGGKNLAGTAVAGKGAPATRLLDEMCESGWLEKTPGRTPKFTVTTQGRETWEQQAGEDRLRQVRERERQKRRQEMVAFLEFVKTKPDKALGTKDLSRFDEALRQQAGEQKLVEPGTKEKSYRLLPAGTEMILAEQPVEKQLEELQRLHGELVARWRAAQLRLGQDLEKASSHTLQAAVEQLAERGTSACQAFDTAVAELGGLAVVAAAATPLRAEIDAALAQAKQTVNAETARLAELESRLRQEAGEQQEQLKAFELRVQERLADVAGKLSAGPAAAPAPPPPAVPEPAAHTRNGTPAEAVVWEAARLAYEQVRQENLRIGGIVKIPDLIDVVRRTVPDLPPGTFHDLLRKWQQEDRLTLQLCDDPRMESRTDEGIQSPRGLLFYVQIR